MALSKGKQDYIKTVEKELIELKENRRNYCQDDINDKLLDTICTLASVLGEGTIGNLLDTLEEIQELSR